MNSTQPLYGLVFCGGQSSRMGSDKSLLEYHGLPQRNYLYQLLNKLCDRVFISCNTSQLAGIPGSMHVIADSPAFSGHGPVSGLLSAFDEYPEAAFLVVGVDYPNVKASDLQLLISQRSSGYKAISYIDSKTLFKEPLLAIYEKDSFGDLYKNFQAGKFSLRAYLDALKEVRVVDAREGLLTNINTPEDFRRNRME